MKQGSFDTSARLPQLDALRGLALFGILIVNIFVFHAPYTHYTAFYGGFEGYQAVVLAAILFLFGGKSMFVFAFLFGYSFWLQRERTTDEASFRAYWRRRMATLAAFGILHILFLSFGDILLPYALLGLSLPWVAKLRSRWLLLIAFLVNLVPFYEFLIRGFIEYPSIFMEPVASLESYVETNRNGSYWEIMKLRLSDYAAFRNEKLVRYIPKEWSLFLLGILMARLNLASSPHRAYGWAFCTVAIPCIVAIGIFQESVIALFDYDASMAERLILGLIIHGYELIHGMLYVVGFFLLWKLPTGEKILAPFQFAGRLSLTNYLMQSLICLVLFSGFHLYGRLSPPELALTAAAIFLGQAIVSALWLRRFEFGPIEFVWRKLSKRQSLNRSATRCLGRVVKR